MRRLIDWWTTVKKYWIARFHLDDAIVCEMSKGSRDFHDYHDTEHKQPDHFHVLRCERCGKEFWL